MTREQSRRLTLELEPDSEPIQGCLLEENGNALQFVGWLGLATALQRAMWPDHHVVSNDRAKGSGK